MEHNSLTTIASARPIIYAEGLFASCYLDNGTFIPEEGLSQTDLWSILNGDLMRSGSDLVEDFTLKCKLNNLENTSSDTYELEQFPKDAVLTAPSSNIPNETVVNNADIDRQEMQTNGIPLIQITPNNKNVNNTTQQFTVNNKTIDSQFTETIDGQFTINKKTMGSQFSVNDEDDICPNHDNSDDELASKFNNTILNINNLSTTTDSMDLQTNIKHRLLLQQHDVMNTPENIELYNFFKKQVEFIMFDNDGEDYVNMELFTSFNETLILLNVLKHYNIPTVVSFLSRRNEPVAITFSRINIGLDCLMFCLFQA